jgi:hypothetical protein
MCFADFVMVVEGGSVESSAEGDAVVLGAA